MVRLLLTSIFLYLSLPSILAQPKIIFDTDFGGDTDDFGALAMLHYLMHKGECEILAVCVGQPKSMRFQPSMRSTVTPR
jgi:hypothetical protein